MEIKIFYAALAFFFVSSSFIEYALTYKKYKGYYNMKDTFSSIKLMLAGLVFDTGIKIVSIYGLLLLTTFAPYHLGYDWWSWILCFVIWDFCFYCKHYVEHHVRFIWAIHVHHHSSSHMNLSTSIRSGVFKGLYRYFFYIPIILMGFPPVMFFTIYGIGKLWAFFSHSQRLGNWGILEKFLITPSHHAVHHSYNDQNLNKNFGETLIIWDKLFGSFQENNGNLKFGIPEQVDHSSFYNTVMHEFENMARDIRSAKNLKEIMFYIFGKPGWNQKKKHTVKEKNLKNKTNESKNIQV
ncbi:MAG: sterol desaturase family protein [Bacteroidetes bacterium]|nr:sterol desaturase family protein [Bacteroidota bacterium]